MTTHSLTGVSLAASLTVNDLDKSMVWYRDVLGFAVDQKYEREGRLMAVSLRAGDVQILLTQDDGSKGLDRMKGEGFSLMITTAQNIDEVAQSVKDAGGTLDTEPVDGPRGMRVFRLRDPDGFRYTVSSKPD